MDKSFKFQTMPKTNKAKIPYKTVMYYNISHNYFILRPAKPLEPHIQNITPDCFCSRQPHFVATRINNSIPGTPYPCTASHCLFVYLQGAQNEDGDRVPEGGFCAPRVYSILLSAPISQLKLLNILVPNAKVVLDQHSNCYGDAGVPPLYFFLLLLLLWEL